MEARAVVGDMVPTAVLVDHIQLADEMGIPIPIPRATVRTWLRQGLPFATLTIHLDGLSLEDLAATPAAVPPAVPGPGPDGPSLHVAEATRQLQRAINALRTKSQMSEDTARMRIRRACDAGELLTTGSGRYRRIDSASFRAWLHQQTEHELDKIDAEEPDTGDWLRLADCARLHVTDVDGLTEKRAKDRVYYAIRTGALLAHGRGVSLRVEPIHFAAWRFAQREADLRRVDE